MYFALTQLRNIYSVATPTLMFLIEEIDVSIHNCFAWVISTFKIATSVHTCMMYFGQYIPSGRPWSWSEDDVIVRATRTYGLFRA